MKHLLVPVNSLSIHLNQQCFTDLTAEVQDRLFGCFVTIDYLLDLDCKEKERKLLLSTMWFA